MEKTEQITNNSTNSFDKMIMKTWIEFLSNLSKKKDEDIEKVLETILNLINDITKSSFFSKEEHDESEKFFINSFAPKLIRILVGEVFSSVFTREIARNILLSFVDLFQKYFELVKFYDIWEAVTEIFSQEKKCNLSSDVCASEKFLVFFLLNIGTKL
jgi:hypothetical protein